MRLEKNNGLTDRMVQYMNDKYADDEFSFNAETGGGAGAVYKTIIVSSRECPDKDIYVRYRKNGDTEEFSDNYLGVKYQQQTEDLMGSVISAVLGSDYRIFYTVDNYACPNDNGTLSFNEYICNKDSNIGFTVVAKATADDKDAIAKALETEITKAGLCCTATVYFDNGSDDYKALTDTNLYAYLYKKAYSAALSFEMENDAGFSATSWE